MVYLLHNTNKNLYHVNSLINLNAVIGKRYVKPQQSKASLQMFTSVL